jgi:hypothetical protein
LAPAAPNAAALAMDAVSTTPVSTEVVVLV